MKKYIKMMICMMMMVSVFIIGGLLNKVDGASYTYMRTTANLNVRSGSSTKYRVIGGFKRGAKVKVISTKNGWRKVKYNGKIGYCYKKYLTKVDKNYKEPKNTSKNTTKKNVKRTLKVKAYAYSGDTITSTGRRPQAGRTIAVDPRVIPYGSKVYIPYFGKTFIAEDCGGGIKGNKIDIFMRSNKECNRFGVKYLTIQILK